MTKCIFHAFCYQKGIKLSSIDSGNTLLTIAYDKYADMLYHLALSHMQNREDAEDVVQEVFCKYFAKPPQFVDDAHEKAWFIRVAVNQCHDHLRRRNIRSYTPLHEIEDLAARTNVQDEEALHLMQTLALLPEKFRIVVILHYLEGFSVEEIAGSLRIGQSAVKMRLSRARKMLEEKLTEE